MENNKLLKIFEESRTISEVLKKLNITDNSYNWKKIKELANDIGFDLETYKVKEKKHCLNCNNELNNKQFKFCSRSCSVSFNNKNRKLSEETKNKISNSLKKQNNTENKNKLKIIKEKKYCLNCGCEIKNNRKFCSLSCSGLYYNKINKIKNYKNFLDYPEKYNRGNYTPKAFKQNFIDEQNGKCAICGLEQLWNDKKLIFVLDHIDGDASNNRRENLRMICPNCDSQTDTFKSKTKNSKRRNYWKEKIIKDIKNGE